MTDEQKYHRKVQTAVTCFLYCGNDYLLLHRGTHKRVDAGRINGVGGRLEIGEDFLNAAIREVKEETGYVVSAEDIQLSALGKLEGGYSEDWVFCCFRIEVPDKKIPLGNKTDDGELIWINKDKVLDSEYEQVDDLKYFWKEMIEGKEIVFYTAKMNEKEKVEAISIGKLETV